jgi:hypothetical protein
MKEAERLVLRPVVQLFPSVEIDVIHHQVGIYLFREILYSYAFVAIIIRLFHFDTVK